MGGQLAARGRAIFPMESVILAGFRLAHELQYDSARLHTLSIQRAP